MWDFNGNDSASDVLDNNTGAFGNDSGVAFEAVEDDLLSDI